MTRDIILKVRLNAIEAKHLDAFAKQSGKTRSQVIRDFIRTLRFKLKDED